jgi:hypothetical protein
MCRRALRIGLPALAFTEHLDLTGWVVDPADLLGDNGLLIPEPLDVAGYLESVERCRGQFPELRILSGVEFGQPHIDADKARQIVDLVSAIVLVLKRGPEQKGIIERAHDYLETSFLPGRTFTGPDDFKAQLQQWLALVATRRRRALGCASIDRSPSTVRRAPLPPVAPATGWEPPTPTIRIDHGYRPKADSQESRM